MSDALENNAMGRSAGLLLVASIFVLAICGLVYELIAGTLSSYLLGDSVTQFSIVIGLFLAAMGVGSYLSKFFTNHLIAWLVGTEVAIGLVGGTTALIGFVAFSTTSLYVPVLLSLVGLVGTLVGLEIPLVVRILRSIGSLRVTLANVMSADYLGALVASVLFPFALLPHMGLVRAGLVVGLANVLVATLVLWRFRPWIPTGRRKLAVASAGSMVVLCAGLVVSGSLVSYLEDRLYQDEIVYACDTPHQRLVLTRWRDDVRLFLNGHLQFSSIDEYRYHEALVHPAMGAAERRDRVLILGGGDGLAVREVLKHEDVTSVDLVDLDPVVTDLFASRDMLVTLNEGSLSDPRVRIHNVDAMRFLQESTDLYDVILMDLPDPSGPSLGKLYSKTFFGLIGRHLARGGRLACQCTSPFRAREAFWCIAHTLASAPCGPGPNDRFCVQPYHTVIPTFGTWGFVLAGAEPVDVATINVEVPTAFLTAASLPVLFVFPADMAEIDTPISSLNDPVVCRLYRQGYHKYLE